MFTEVNTFFLNNKIKIFQNILKPLPNFISYTLLIIQFNLHDNAVTYNYKFKDNYIVKKSIHIFKYLIIQNNNLKY